MKSPKTVIAEDKRMSIIQHDFDDAPSAQRVYSDGSGLEGDVTSIAIEINWEIGKRLGGPEMAITHHEELKGLTARTERLAAVAQADENCRGKLYKVYSDSQASLKVVDAMRSTTDQGRLKRVQNACESIRRREVELKLHWIAGHAEVSRNEAANEVANKTHDTTLSPSKHRRCEVTARLALINLQARQT